MNSYANWLIEKYARSGILIDANILLILAVGKKDTTSIPRFCRGKHCFEAKDYQLVCDFVRSFRRIMTLPNIVTEVDNLLGNRKDHEAFCGSMVQVLDLAEEKYLETKVVVKAQCFAYLGLTDSAIAYAALTGQCPVFSSDATLCKYLNDNLVPALNFWHLKSPDLRFEV